MAPARFVGRALRRVVALALFGLIRGRRVVVAVAAVAFVGWFALANVGRLPGVPAGTLPSWLPGQSSAPAAASKPASGAAAGAPVGRLRPVGAEAVPSVDSYIKGLTQFDAKLMWGSLSDDALSTM